MIVWTVQSLTSGLTDKQKEAPPDVESSGALLYEWNREWLYFTSPPFLIRLCLSGWDAHDYRELGWRCRRSSGFDWLSRW